MSNSSKKWMVRASDIISGPYTTEEVQRLLSDGDMPLTIEVTEPCSYWFALQGHPDFEEFIRTIDSNNIATRVITKVTKKISSFTDTDRTVTKKQKLETDSFAGEAKNAVFTVAPPDSMRVKKLKAARYGSGQIFQDTINKRTNFFISSIWRGVIVLFVFVLSYILYQKLLSPLNRNKAIANQVQSEGMKLYYAGAYNQALPFFEAGLKYDLLTFDQKLIISAFLIQNNNIRTAKKILSQFSVEENKNPKVFLLKGLIHFYNKEWSAAESYFLKAKSEESQSGSMNIGILKFAQKDYLSSLQHTKQMTDEGYTRGLAYYLDILNRVKLQQQDLIFYIQSMLRKTPEYSQEMYLLLAYLHLKQKNTEMTNLFLQKSLNEDPFFNSEYQYSAFTARKYIDWSHLLNYCKFIYNSNADNFLYNLIYGLCFLKSGIRYKGMEYIEKAKNQNPKNPLVLSIYAYSLINEESFSEAETQLELAISYNFQKYNLPYVLRAYFYEKKNNWSSALKDWEHVLYNNESHIPAIAGVAYNSFKLNKLEETSVLRDQVLEMYPYYSRAILLKD